jgi:hypothetical protein
MRYSITLYQFATRAQILVVLLQKVIGYSSEPFACGIRELHATPSMAAIYRWENLILNK